MSSPKRRLTRRTFLSRAGVSVVGSAIGMPRLLHSSEHEHRIVFSCPPGNDLYRALAAEGKPFPRFDGATAAVDATDAHGGVMILADGYPAQKTELSAEIFQIAAEKNLRLFVEYPSFLPGQKIGDALKTSAINDAGGGAGFERAVVASEAFGAGLPKLSILSVNHCWFVPTKAEHADLVIARVAGYDTAVYGLPQDNVEFGTRLQYPILFELANKNVLVSTTKLSQFITARYEPNAAWTLVWRRILGWVTAGQGPTSVSWTPVVRPTSDAVEALPASAETQAFRRGVAWYKNAKMFPQASWSQRRDAGVPVPVQPVPPGAQLGDGSAGVLEGFCGRIEYDGSQLPGWTSRNDCAGEVSMAMALSAAIDGASGDARIAANLNDYIYFTSPLAQGPRADPKSPSYGLVGGNTLTNGVGIYYADDNCRSLLGTMATAALLKSDRWDEAMLRCLLGNLRTTGRLGFRGEKLRDEQLQKWGWQHFFDADTVFYEPHFEAYPWATYLWAYDKTRQTLFLNRTKNAIKMLIAAYPEQWRWTNGIQQERARLLLPLAWLIRVDDQPEHRDWLRRIASDMISFQDASGAIREEIGPADHGYFPPPSSNDAYGTDEAPLIQRNGDPACDLLYTSNFAFLGLHEAAAATHESIYARAESKLAELLMRIQVKSEAHPELEGAWLRGFDYKRWDYWASGSDWGWGPWACETGWIQSWISSLFGLRHLNTSLWDLTRDSQIARHLPKLLPTMLGDRV